MISLWKLTIYFGLLSSAILDLFYRLTLLQSHWVRPIHQPLLGDDQQLHGFLRIALIPNSLVRFLTFITSTILGVPTGFAGSRDSST